MKTSHDPDQGITPRAPELVSCPTCGCLVTLRATLCVRCGRDNPSSQPVRVRRSNREHVHRRDRYCASMFPDPLRPTKAASIWLYAWADAIQTDVTFIDFIIRYPAEFPGLSVTS